ncbi:hypothetical protein [Acidocella sp.]|uniref:hypothetical protein n=1 Tax=Acidocella sp. TaxID=50710 RepID=UPI0026134EC0|nr:hypothetical protein [Acidocella sp.]
MQTLRKSAAYGKLALGIGMAAVALAGCSRPTPKLAAVPPAPIGHVYPVAIDVPSPVSPKIKFTPVQLKKVQQAFNVIGLKSALMVAALSCGEEDQYDAFMHSFQPHVLSAQHQMDAYFYKASGPYSGRKMEDNFITLLANRQSAAGIAQGNAFCLNNQAEFHAVLALKTASALDNFVTDKPPLKLANASQ